MNKADLVKELEGRMEALDHKTAATAVDNVVEIVIRSVTKGEKVSITGFGVFEKRRRNARTARNPATGAAVKVKATNVPAFRPGAGFKEYVAGTKKLVKATGPAKKTVAKTTARKITGTKATSTAKATAAAKKVATKASAHKTASKTTTAKKTSAKKAPAKKATRSR